MFLYVTGTQNMRLKCVLVAATAVLGTASAWGFKKPCPLDVDICGWALQSDYG